MDLRETSSRTDMVVKTVNKMFPNLPLTWELLISALAEDLVDNDGLRVVSRHSTDYNSMRCGGSWYCLNSSYHLLCFVRVSVNEGSSSTENEEG